MAERARIERLHDLEKRIGYCFKDITLLERALTHASYTNREGKKVEDNESMEFLGDALVGMIVSEYMYINYPEHSEGELSQARAFVVSRVSLAEEAKKLGLGEFLRLGRGEEASGGRGRNSILANAFEALVAAIYLDRGLKECRQFVISRLGLAIKRALEAPNLSDYKSRLQEYAQAYFSTKPEYKVVAEWGPGHRRTFEVEVYIEGKWMGKGVGFSKKAAEQRAAQDALERIKEENAEG